MGLKRTAFKRKPKARKPRDAAGVPKALGKSAPGYKAIGRDQDHMARVAALGCMICRLPAQAHHVDTVVPKGMGPKVSDYLTLPLCPKHHTDDRYNSAHGALGERAFWDSHWIDEGAVILSILRKWYPSPGEHVSAAIAAIEKQRELSNG